MLYWAKIISKAEMWTKEKTIYKDCLRNRYAMACPPVRGYNLRALASGFSYVQVDKHGITIKYYRHQCRPCTSRDISCLSW